MKSRRLIEHPVMCSASMAGRKAGASPTTSRGVHFGVWLK
jgi:hypothetical protein